MTSVGPNIPVHLHPFNFSLSCLSVLSTLELSIAIFHPESEAHPFLPLQVSRLWFLRREAARSTPHTPPVDDLRFPLHNLSELTSHQLALIQFHPALLWLSEWQQDALLIRAENVFRKRRDRDFARGLRWEGEDTIPAAAEPPGFDTHPDSKPPHLGACSQSDHDNSHAGLLRDLVAEGNASRFSHESPDSAVISHEDGRMASAPTIKSSGSPVVPPPSFHRGSSVPPPSRPGDSPPRPQQTHGSTSTRSMAWAPPLPPPNTRIPQMNGNRESPEAEKVFQPRLRSCHFCRQRRRTCEWIEEERTCKLCKSKSQECSGPAKPTPEMAARPHRATVPKVDGSGSRSHSASTSTSSSSSEGPVAKRARIWATDAKGVPTQSMVDQEWFGGESEGKSNCNKERRNEGEDNAEAKRRQQAPSISMNKDTC